MILCLVEDVYESGLAQISAKPSGNRQCCSSIIAEITYILELQIPHYE